MHSPRLLKELFPMPDKEMPTLPDNEIESENVKIEQCAGPLDSDRKASAKEATCPAPFREEVRTRKQTGDAFEIARRAFGRDLRDNAV